MTVEVSFCMNIGENVCLSEKDMDTSFDDYRSELLANDNHYGEVVISSPGQPDIRIDDEVWATIQNLCFLAIPNLRAGKPVVVLYFRYDSELRLDPEGQEVLISGEFIPMGKVKLQELIPALYSCGKRFINFLRRLGGDNPNYTILIKHLEEQAEIARQALDRK